MTPQFPRFYFRFLCLKSSCKMYTSIHFIFIAVLFMVIKVWTHLKIFINYRVDNCQDIHAVEYLSVGKRNSRYKTQHKWALRTKCWTTKANHRIIHIAWFHLYCFKIRNIKYYVKPNRVTSEPITRIYKPITFRGE